jgi:hypothetical protein
MGGTGGTGGLEGNYFWSCLQNNAPTPTVGSWSIIDENLPTYNYYWWGYNGNGNIVYSAEFGGGSILATVSTVSHFEYGTTRGLNGDNGSTGEGYDNN